MYDLYIYIYEKLYESDLGMYEEMLYTHYNII